ncbi:MAG: hypothetical protein EOO22_11855 [Comamonadaceae bacterium]|nr:MAG: hypothetical protein EOO22_11855 [Comamonadaceae bacterium]
MKAPAEALLFHLLPSIALPQVANAPLKIVARYGVRAFGTLLPTLMLSPMEGTDFLTWIANHDVLMEVL